MLNKEALTRLNAPQYHFKFRVGNDPSHDWDRGWVKETKGVYPAVGEALSPIPYWIEPNNYLERCSSTSSSTGFRSKATRSPQITNRIICRDETGAEIYRDFSYGYCFDYYSNYTRFLRDMLGQVVYVTFDPPPLQDISKKVKQVFTRSRKEGVVNAGEGNAYRVGYTRKGKYHQRHGVHCTGDPRWKFSLDYTSWQNRKGQRTYRGCGISIFPRLGWKLTRACHHEHIEKYITHWLYRFPSKAPNGRLIRKYLLNLGVTSQLEVPYAA